MKLYRSAYLYKRWKWAKIAKRTPLGCLYERILPPLNTPVEQCTFLVADCEMSGLKPSQHDLLSIGWVRIEQGMIDYASRQHLLIHSRESVGDSIKIHGLCDSRIAGASSPSKALSVLAQQAKNTVLVFHHAVLDKAFLQKAAVQTFGCPLVFPLIDTMDIEQRRLTRQSKTASVQLNLCRDRYGLPPAFAHNAMFDAVATAELLLAQWSYMKTSRPLTLGELRPHIA